MHSMSNLNKFKDSYQVLENNLGLCYLKKQKFWFITLKVYVWEANLQRLDKV
jgi:hypothetical protein